MLFWFMLSSRAMLRNQRAGTVQSFFVGGDDLRRRPRVQTNEADKERANSFLFSPSTCLVHRPWVCENAKDGRPKVLHLTVLMAAFPNLRIPSVRSGEAPEEGSTCRFTEPNKVQEEMKNV